MHSNFHIMIVINKGNSSIPLFEIHKSIKKKIKKQKKQIWDTN